MLTNVPTKPAAPNSYEEKRWNHTALRRRLLQGLWEQDLEDELARHLPSDRRQSWGPSDMSSNALSQVTKQLSMLYHQQPTVTHRDSQSDISALVQRDGLLQSSGLWQLQQRTQQMTLALRECFLRIDVVTNNPGQPYKKAGLVYRLVTPDFVICTAADDAPDVPLYYQEYRLRMHPITSDPHWVADVLDIRDPNNPVFALYEIESNGQLGSDVSDLYLGHPAMIGDAYPYRAKDGTPILPVQLYHAERTGALFNAFDQSMLTFGSLCSAVLYTFYVHCVRDNSWPQKYVAGLSVAGLSGLDQDNTARRSAVSTDPSSILVFNADPDMQGQPLIGSFQYADPHKLLESISKYEYRVATAAGISSEVLKQSGDPRSGFALSISRDGQRQSQRVFAPIFRAADEELLAKSAMLANRFLGLNLPEDGYRVQYSNLPMSPEEQRAQTEDIIKKLDAGLISPVDAMLILNPDLNEDEAKRELDRIRRQRAEFTL